MMSAQPPDDSDAVLVAALAGGDQSAAARLTQRYWPAIHRFCASYLGDDALAEDVTQETFAKLSSGADLPTGAFKPWIYKVARNRCLDILRRHQRSPTHHHNLRTGFDAAQSTAGPPTRAARAERAELTRRVIESMPDEYKSVLMLKYYEGLSREEMAETLGITEAAVKGRLARASEHLREELLKHTRMHP